MVPVGHSCSVHGAWFTFSEQEDAVEEEAEAEEETEEPKAEGMGLG
jgi:hypothetical protein